MDLEGIIEGFKKFGRIVVLGTALYLPFGGCGGGGNGNGGSDKKDVIIPKTTKVMDVDSTGKFLSASDTSLTYSGNTPQIDSLQIGDVYISDVNAVTENGFIRKVDNISTVGTDIVIDTSPADLEDAIEKGSAQINKVLTSSDVKSKILRAGVNKTIGSPGSFSVTLNNVILYDADGDELTTGDQIIANGFIDFDPSFDFEIDIDNFKIQYLNFVNSTTETAQLEITSQISILDIHKKKEIANYTFTPIVFYIGPVPVVLTPQLAVNVGFDGKVSADIMTDVTQQATVTAGLTYDGSQWSSVKDFTNSFNFNTPTISNFDVLMEAYAGPNLSLLLYGVAGPYGEIKGYTQFDLDTSRVPLWILEGGLESKLSIDVSVLGKSLISYNKTLFDYSKILALSDTVAFLSDRDGNYEIYLVDVASSNQMNLTNTSFNEFIPFSWSPTKDKIAVISQRNGNDELYVIDVRTLESKLLFTNPGICNMNLLWSPDGKKIAFTSDMEDGGMHDLYIMERDGSKIKKIYDSCIPFSWFSDGSKILIESYNFGEREVSILDLTSLIETNLTNNIYRDDSPSLSPDESKIAFISNRDYFGDTNYELYVMNVDGSFQKRLTYTDGPWELSPLWSPNGKITYMSELNGTLKYDILVINADGTNQINLTNNPSNDKKPSWSSKGDKLTFYTNRDGNYEIYVMNADGTNQINLTNNSASDTRPVWSP